MEIKVNQFYVNKTRKFLLPLIRTFGEEFLDRYNSIYKFAVGVHDINLNIETYVKNKPLIYIMIDKVSSSSRGQFFLDWLVTQDYYVHDYVASQELSSRMHMVVLKFNEEYEYVYERFMLGNYSAMYTEEEIDTFFRIPREKVGTESRKIYDYALQVLTKSENALFGYRYKVNKLYNADLNVENLRDHLDYELPLDPSEEIFNLGKQSFEDFNPIFKKVWTERRKS
jgi:hypothetical protein